MVVWVGGYRCCCTPLNYSILFDLQCNSAGLQHSNWVEAALLKEAVQHVHCKAIWAALLAPQLIQADIRKLQKKGTQIPIIPFI
jgi:heterodisulfide reductase subunit A-like polyferredoxin